MENNHCHQIPIICFSTVCCEVLETPVWIAGCGIFIYLSRFVTKQTKWHVHPAKTKISLGIRPVWSESLLSAWRKLGSLATHWAHSEDSDQTGRMPRLIWVFAGRTCHFVGFVMRWLYLFLQFIHKALTHCYHLNQPNSSVSFLISFLDQNIFIIIFFCTFY